MDSVGAEVLSLTRSSNEKDWMNCKVSILRDLMPVFRRIESSEDSKRIERSVEEGFEGL